jgi:hypothetical protein
MATGTSFSDIFDSFLLLINDYKLINLYESSEVDFETYLSGWLLYAIQDFSTCTQDLSYSASSKTFTETLTTENQLLLARMMVKYWLSKEVADVTQMSIHLQDRDFKTFSEAANLTAKSNHLLQIKEDISQALVEYGLRKNDWANWYAGIFYTP